MWHHELPIQFKLHYLPLYHLQKYGQEVQIVQQIPIASAQIGVSIQDQLLLLLLVMWEQQIFNGWMVKEEEDYVAQEEEGINILRYV